MALIKCPECKREISNRANSCPYCGCPLAETITTGTVRIKMPNNVVDGWVGLFSSRKAEVRTVSGKILWEGSHGENARFTVSAPTKIVIDLGRWANDVEGIVYPRRKYSLIQDMGAHMLATYRLTEVDYIDAD